MSRPDDPDVPTRSLLIAATAVAVSVPTLLAFNLPPSSTLLNQLAGLIGWGIVGALLAVLPAAGASMSARPWRDAWPLHLALVLLGLAAATAPWWTSQPTSLAASNIGLIFAAWALLQAGLTAQRRGLGDMAYAALWHALLLAGIASLAIGAVQVFRPDLADGDWIARTGFPGRAVGNLRQPNHLSTLLLWSAVAVIALAEQAQLRRSVARVLFVAMLLGIVMTASRTGLVGIVLLAAWGGLDRRLTRATRGLLLAAPVVYALGWLALAGWAHWSGQVFGGEQRLTADGDLSSSRFGIWSNTLSLIAAHPWLGVGFGEFNFAWTLTPFPGRPVAFFDHTHNLLLQFAVELGLPLALLVLALLLAALGRAGQLAVRAVGGDGIDRRAGLMVLVVVGLHSQLEYPLWYAYFLLPTALVFGLGLGLGQGARAAPGQDAAASRGATAGGEAVGEAPASPAVAAAAVMVMLGGLYGAVDYMSAVAIYTASDRAPPLAERIAAGQRSLFFGHQGDYAAATTALPEQALPAATRAAHFLLDARLMMAWSEAYAANGDVDRARHVAARLREFRHEQGERWFEACAAKRKPGTPPPFQCEPPPRALGYGDFR